MSRKILVLILVAGLAISFLLGSHNKISKVYGMPNFTVVTRTPTPPPAPPTATPDTDPGDPNPPPPPDITDEPPQPTATSTLVPVTLVATPVGGYLPTAVACGFPPTLQAQNNTNVRTGPGTDYDIVGQLVYLETRIIIGRALDSEWWIIQFSNDEIGWVANNVVEVHGNTSGIPILPPPEINGETPTPGPLWNPTPNPECPITPSPTPAPTATPTVEIVEKAVATDTTEPPTDTPEPDTPEPTEKSEATATATATSVVPTVEESSESDEVEATATPSPTAVPLDEEAESPPAAGLLPCSTAMISLAILGFLAFRRIF